MKGFMNIKFIAMTNDLAAVGRYKYDKKLSIAGRITGQTLVETVVSPLTGEVIAEAGTLLDRDTALAIQHAAINEVTVRTESGREVRVFGNGSIEPVYVLGYDLADIGITEKVRYSVLREIIEQVNEENPLITEEDPEYKSASPSESCSPLR